MFQFMSMVSLPTMHYCEEPVSITLITSLQTLGRCCSAEAISARDWKSSASLSSSFLKKPRVEARRGGGKEIVGPYYGAIVLLESLLFCPEAEESKLCLKVNGTAKIIF